jgi:hypothetical protein
LPLYKYIVVQFYAHIWVDVDSTFSLEQLHGFPKPLLCRGNSHQLPLKSRAMNHVPRVVPACIRRGEVNLFDYVAALGAFNIAIHQAGVQVLGLDAPTRQDASDVGAEVDCCTFVADDVVFVNYL